MATLLGWLRQQGAWIRSQHYELPAVQHACVSAELRPWCALAGGLALVLSRQATAEVQGSYPIAAAVFERVRQSLEAGREPRVSRKVLLYLAKEIEAVADPLTRASCLACMSRPRKGASTFSDSVSLSEMSCSATSNGQLADFDDYVTQLSPDVFSRRSEQLRRTVAGARRADKA